jgi:hypothetical protein
LDADDSVECVVDNDETEIADIADAVVDDDKVNCLVKPSGDFTFVTSVR